MDFTTFSMFNSLNSQVNTSANLASQRAEESSTRVRHAEERLDRLSIICMAMWKILQEKTNTTDEELLEAIKEIDMTDGKLDGKVRQEVLRCSKCDRVITKKHNRCLYCGEPVENDQSVFGGVLE